MLHYTKENTPYIKINDHCNIIFSKSTKIDGNYKYICFSCRNDKDRESQLLPLNFKTVNNKIKEFVTNDIIKYFKLSIQDYIINNQINENDIPCIVRDFIDDLVSNKVKTSKPKTKKPVIRKKSTVKKNKK
jgi:hypothetical protein